MENKEGLSFLKSGWGFKERKPLHTVSSTKMAARALQRGFAVPDRAVGGHADIDQGGGGDDGKEDVGNQRRIPM